MNNSLNNWQRLSPFSVVFFIGKTLVHLLRDALPALAPMLVIVFASNKKLTVTLALIIGLSLLIIGSAILQFWFFKYRRQGDKILINDGVFKKNHRVIHFDRIQNVNILTPVYFRPFGLVVLKIETAGSKGNEADLGGIPAATATTLRTEILQHQQTVATQSGGIPATDASESDGELIASASLKDLVAYGVSSNGVFFLLVILAPLMGVFFSSFKDFARTLIEQLIIPVLQFLGDGPAGKIGAGLLMITFVILLMFLFSILGAIYRYYGYKLSAKQTSLKRHSGLLTRFEESLKIIKVQTFVSQSNFIGRLIRRQNIIFGQVASSHAGQPGKRNAFIIPARRQAEIPDLKKLVFADVPDEIPEQAIDRRYILKTWLIWFVSPMTIIAGYYLTQQSYQSAGIAAIVAIIMLPLVIKRWRMYRFGHAQNYGVFQSGLFGFKRTLFPLYKVQRTEIRQSPLQRRRKLATLRISLAAGEIVIPYISMQQANQYLENIQSAIKTNRAPWF
ncbi:MAG: PH domain-containing protein [Xanthomonadales bacterium]|nr:PH domain-containing protein [Xanthomonadales bacterium]